MMRTECFPIREAHRLANQLLWQFDHARSCGEDEYAFFDYAIQIVSNLTANMRQRRADAIS